MFLLVMQNSRTFGHAQLFSLAYLSEHEKVDLKRSVMESTVRPALLNSQEVL
jgi:hypothetical protein